MYVARCACADTIPNGMRVATRMASAKSEKASTSWRRNVPLRPATGSLALTRSLIGGQPVTEPADGLDVQRLARVVTQLSAQAAQVNVDGLAALGKAHVPHSAADLAPANQCPGRPHEQPQ